MAGPGLCQSSAERDLYEGGSPAEKFARRPAILSTLEETQPAELTGSVFTDDLRIPPVVARLVFDLSLKVITVS